MINVLLCLCSAHVVEKRSTLERQHRQESQQHVPHHGPHCHIHQQTNQRQNGRIGRDGIIDDHNQHNVHNHEAAKSRLVLVDNVKNVSKYF